MVDDGKGGQTTGRVESEISPINDAPEAVNDFVAALEDELVSFDPVANGTDIDEGDVLTLDSAFPTDGTVTIRGNTIDAGSGFDFVDGGSGDDTLVLTGLPGDYTVFANGGKLHPDR